MRKFIIAVCVLAAAFAFIMDGQISAAAVAATVNKFHIVLDAGHGGLDGGATVGNVREAEINLSMVRILEKELTARGFLVSLTRTDSESLASPYAVNKKKDDMLKRRQKIRKLEPNLVISIHQNIFPSASVYGLQCFYATENAGSEEYAQVIQKQFNDSGLITYRTVKKTDFNLCEHGSAPTVLIECGFLSNPTERRLLQTEEYRGILAWNIAAALTQMQTI